MLAILLRSSYMNMKSRANELYQKTKICLTVLAENRIRGLILFEMHTTLAEFSRRHTEEDTLVLLLVIF